MFIDIKQTCHIRVSTASNFDACSVSEKQLGSGFEISDLMFACRTSLAGIKSRSGSVSRVKLLKRWRSSPKRRLMLC